MSDVLEKGKVKEKDCDEIKESFKKINPLTSFSIYWGVVINYSWIFPLFDVWDWKKIWLMAGKISWYIRKLPKNPLICGKWNPINQKTLPLFLTYSHPHAWKIIKRFVSLFQLKVLWNVFHFEWIWRKTQTCFMEIFLTRRDIFLRN